MDEFVIIVQDYLMLIGLPNQKEFIWWNTHAFTPKFQNGKYYGKVIFDYENLYNLPNEEVGELVYYPREIIIDGSTFRNVR